MSAFTFATSGSAISISRNTDLRLHLKFTNGKFEIQTNAECKDMNQVNELKAKIKLFITKLVDKKKSYTQRMNEVAKLLGKHADSNSLKVLNNRIQKELDALV